MAHPSAKLRASIINLLYSSHATHRRWPTHTHTTCNTGSSNSNSSRCKCKCRVQLSSRYLAAGETFIGNCIPRCALIYERTPMQPGSHGPCYANAAEPTIVGLMVVGPFLICTTRMNSHPLAQWMRANYVNTNVKEICAGTRWQSDFKSNVWRAQTYTLTHTYTHVPTATNKQQQKLSDNETFHMSMTFA